LRDTYWPVVHHLLAKDILRFHCVYWPAMLMSAGYDVPQQLFVHGYLLLDDRKISKSLGNIVDPLELIDVYGVDAVRYWMARAVSFGQDGSASIDGIRERYDNELANDLGNLLSRTTAMIARYRGGALRAVTPDQPVDFDALREDVARRLDGFDITGALDQIWEAVRRLNQYVTAEEPWRLAKDDANAQRLDAVLFTLADGLTALAVALAAYLPETAPRILAALRQPAELDWGRVKNGGARAAEGIEASEPLFPRIELSAPAA
jgi:methionyl-tRNA synthetase